MLKCCGTLGKAIWKNGDGSGEEALSYFQTAVTGYKQKLPGRRRLSLLLGVLRAHSHCFVRTPPPSRHALAVLPLSVQVSGRRRRTPP